MTGPANMPLKGRANMRAFPARLRGAEQTVERLTFLDARFGVGNQMKIHLRRSFGRIAGYIRISCFRSRASSDGGQLLLFGFCSLRCRLS
ncbi:MAG: hypothetical protein ACRDL8_22060, partial [Solirubrobacteraceae bacterium]